jgi:hypothetical protein
VISKVLPTVTLSICNKEISARRVLLGRQLQALLDAVSGVAKHVSTEVYDCKIIVLINTVLFVEITCCYRYISRSKISYTTHNARLIRLHISG